MTTLDTIITDLRNNVNTSDYVRMCWGRAMVFQEKWNDRVVQVPKVNIGSDEYITPLPNDKNEPIVFFQALASETFGEYNKDAISPVTRQIALTWWGKISDFSLEDAKWDIIRKLQQSAYVSSIDNYVDERYQDVFPDFSGYITRNDTEQGTQWLMAPYSGFRLTFTVSYNQLGGGEC